MTIASLLFDAVKVLTSAGFDTPRLDAEILLAFALGWNRTKLLAYLNEEISPNSHLKFRGLIARRLNKEPVAYIRGVKEFYGLPFLVTPDTLIPRPETELLIDMALEWLSAKKIASTSLDISAIIDASTILNVPTVIGAPAILDVGTGSGNLAIALAYYLNSLQGKHAQVFAVDISENAIKIAKENALRIGVSDKISWFLGDLLDPLPKEKHYNIVVANLPYVPTKEWENLPPGVRMEPRLALVGGENGLLLIKRLLSGISVFLASPHAVFLELGPGQAELIPELPEVKDFAVLEVRKDLLGIPRVAHLELR